MPDAIIPRLQASGDPIVDLFDAYQRSVAALNGTTLEDEKPQDRAMTEAMERFAFAPTTSLVGFLLKLELIAELEDYAGHLQENPQLLAARAILGMIDDIRRTLGMPVPDRQLPRRLKYNEAARLFA